MRIAVIRDKVRWRNNSPGRMTDSNEGLGTARSERPPVDLRLVPQFKPAGVERLRDVNRGTRRRLGRRERGQDAKKAFVPIGGGEQRQHDKTERLAQFLSRFDHCRVWPADQQDLARIVTQGECCQELMGEDAAPRKPDHNQIKKSLVEVPAQLIRFRRLANDITKFFQSVAQERAHVPVAVADASGPRHFSSTERSCREGSGSFHLMMTHRAISASRTTSTREGSLHPFSIRSVRRLTLCQSF